MKIDTFLQNLGIVDHPGLFVDRKRTGYQDYAFGCRAGSRRASISNLAHELAHAAQFGPRYFKYRAFPWGFEFRMRQVYLMGRLWADPQTPMATLRELDTYAYQAHLMELAGMQFDRERYFRAASRLMTRQMTDWACVPGDSARERRAWCLAKAKEFYARRRPETVLRRLKEWLDKTAIHLASQALPN